MGSRMPLKDPDDIGISSTANSTASTTDRAQANYNAYLNAGTSSSNSNLPRSTLSIDSASVEFVEVVPNLKETEKHVNPQASEEEDSGGAEDEHDGDSQEAFEEIENPNCINPNYLFHANTLTTQSSSDGQMSPIIPTPEAESSIPNKGSSVASATSKAHSDKAGHSEKSPIALQSQHLTVDPTPAADDRVSRMADLALVESSQFNVLAFNVNARTSTPARTDSPTAANVGDILHSCSQGGVGHVQTFTRMRVIQNRPFAQLGNRGINAGLVSIPRFIVPGTGNNCVQLAGSRHVARLSPSDPGRDRPIARYSGVRGNRLETATTSTRATTRSTATASVPVDLDLAPRLQSLQRWSNRVHTELSSRVRAQEQLVDLRWRASDTLYNLGHQLEEISALTRRLHRQQRTIRETEDLLGQAAARKRGRRHE